VKKPGILLAIVGGLIGIGMILSVYGNYLMFEDLSQGSDDVSLEKNLTIKSLLDHTRSQKGIYAVQIMNFENTSVIASILDPSNSEIESHSINEELFEGSFDVDTSGNYTLLIENNGEQAKIFGVIGPEPDDWKKSLDFASFIILALRKLSIFSNPSIAAPKFSLCSIT
jgi:hypothetical protein